MTVHINLIVLIVAGAWVALFVFWLGVAYGAQIPEQPPEEPDSDPWDRALDELNRSAGRAHW